MDIPKDTLAGESGGAALPVAATTTYLRADGNYVPVNRRAAEPAAVVGETFPRVLASAASSAMTSGTVYACAIDLDEGVTVSDISLLSVAAEATGTHAWVGLADDELKVLAVSADNTGAAYFAADTATTTALASPFTTTYAGRYYVFVCVAAGTVPTFAAAPALEHANLSAVVPVACGSSDASKTTPYAVGAAMTALTATTGHLFYAWLT